MNTPDQIASEREALLDALTAFDRGASMLEEAYRELWKSREVERSEMERHGSESIRDLCHEIGNPLTGVRGLADLLARELNSTNASERAKRLLDKMRHGLEVMHDLTATRGSASTVAADAGTLIDEAVGLSLAANRAEAGAVDFSIEVPDGVELPVSGSDFRVIVGNLVRNATEACGTKGRVGVCLASTASEVTLTVTDTGGGFPDVPHDVLFRRGFSTKGPGRGRGLALVIERVEHAGGRVRITRTPENETQVRVTIPRGGQA